MAGIKQINITYDSLEDRLLLRLTADEAEGCAEYKIWLTRRYTGLLWQTLAQIVEAEIPGPGEGASDDREAMKQFRQEAALGNSDFSTPYKGEAERTPLGSLPLLVSRLQCQRQDENLHRLSLHNSAGIGINLTLNTILTHSLQKLLADSIQQAGWNRPLATGTGEAILPAGLIQ